MTHGRTVRRRIMFYGMRDEDTGEPLDHGFGRELATAIQSLDSSKNEHLLDIDGGQFLSAYASLEWDVPALQFGRVRREDLPLVQRGRDVRGLSLAEDEGVLENSHILIFPGSVLGIEYNHFAPRAARLPWYVRKMCPSLPSIQVGPLIRRDAHERIQRMSYFTAVEFAIGRPNLSRDTENSDDLMEILREADGMFGGETYRITVGRTRGSRGRLTGRGFLERFAMDRGARDAASTFKVTGYDPEVDESVMIDLLQEHIVVDSYVAKLDDSSRAVNSDAMFGQIRAAYENNFDEIQESLWIYHDL